MENCIYGGGILLGLFNHQSEKSVQTESTLLETYIVKDFFDSNNRPNLCFERINAKAESLNIAKSERPSIEDFIQKNDGHTNGIELAQFEEQFIKAQMVKPSDQSHPTSSLHPAAPGIKKDSKIDSKAKPPNGPTMKYLKVDFKERRYKCETCNKRFVNSSDFKRHIKIHTDEKLFVCSICTKGKHCRGNLSFFFSSCN